MTLEGFHIIAINPCQRQKLPLGDVVITSNALTAIPAEEQRRSLQRHADGDWGELCDEDRQENERSLTAGGRLMSVYRTDAGVKFWIITECDRSVTTILLPEDY